MMKGKRTMIYLKIENGRGFFLSENTEWAEMDRIKKDDILFLLDKATADNDSFKMDEYDEKEIKNEADRIIYENIYNKFKHILDNKKQFLDESDSLYKDAFQKYDNHPTSSEDDNVKSDERKDIDPYKTGPEKSLFDL